MHKYEGKQTAQSFSDPLYASRQTCVFDRCSGELAVSFILAAKSFSEMFTTYSHALLFCLASGLETRNRFQNRQEKNEQKMNFIFHHEQKFS
jgi:hypothetical protein